MNFQTESDGWMDRQDEGNRRKRLNMASDNRSSVGGFMVYGNSNFVKCSVTFMRKKMPPISEYVPLKS
jgi:hypothetical protein